jgi:hypothetical protein
MGSYSIVMSSDKKNLLQHRKNDPSVSESPTSQFCSMHIITPAANLHRIINLLKCHKFSANAYISFSIHSLALLILHKATKKKEKKSFFFCNEKPQHAVLICVVVLSMKIVFHFDFFFLLDALVFVCDCCRKFLLPFVAVTTEFSCTLDSRRVTKR